MFLEEKIFCDDCPNRKENLKKNGGRSQIFFHENGIVTYFDRDSDKVAPVMDPHPLEKLYESAKLCSEPITHEDLSGKFARLKSFFGLNPDVVECRATLALGLDDKSPKQVKEFVERTYE